MYMLEVWGVRAFAPPTGKCSARGVMRVREGLLETDLWGQISVLLLFFFFFFSSSLLSAFWLVGGWEEGLGYGPGGSD